MKNDPKRKNTKKANSRKWRAHWKKVVSTLAAVTVFCTTYALILPAITVNSNTYCGLEEHEHTEACYTKELICGFEEGEAQGESGETAPETVTETVTEIVTETVIEKEIQQVLVDEGHVHQDSCYEETRNLVCGLEETESKEAVLDEEGNVIEEAVEGHTHTDECYQVERVLVCGQEEREPVYEEQEVEVEKEVQKEVEVPVEQPAQPAQPAGEPHVHTDACYKEVLTCGKEEHKHVDECFSNPTLDLETAADWEKTLPKEDELTENWAEDVLTIAKSQLGYKESSRNFKAVNGDRKGYTRYGARFGAPYSDWCAMFIQFAMHYAGVDERLMPGNPSVSKWIENVKKIENYFEPADYTPVPGDIMFIDWDKVVEGVERDGDHIGIVAEVKTTEETTPDGAKLEVPTSIVTIEGNLDNEVKYNTYKIDDERILGYSHMPEKPETEEELEERVEEIEALIEGKELIEGEEGAEGEEPAEGTEEENEEIVVDTIIALASYTESGVQVNFEAPSSVFPEGTVDPALNVVEILPGTPEYDEYFAQAQANAGTEVLNARFFDISVVDLEGNEIKLNDESLAKVEIIFPENETMTTEGNIDVLHFAEEGLEVLESQVQGREEVEAITFDTTSFSPYGVVQTPKSGEGSTDGSSKPALAEKRKKSDGTGDEYVVTSWEALRNLIESKKYMDVDGTEKTDAPNTMTVVIDGIIAANSGIDAVNKTITLTGTNNATVYINSTATSIGNQLFWIDKGSFNVTNVTFSGQKATYKAGSASNTCKKDVSESEVKEGSGGALTIDDLKFGRTTDKSKLVADNSVSDGYRFYVDSKDNTTGYFRIKDATHFLGTTGSGSSVKLYLTDSNDPTEDKYYWKRRSDGVLVNKANSNYIIWKNPKDDTVSVVEETTTQGCDSTPTAGTWEPVPDSNINNLVNNNMKGFFIVADEGAQVTLGTGTVIKDMKYTGDNKHISPIWVNGRNGQAKLTIDGATIQNNRASIPKNGDGNPVTYAVELLKDLNWNGASRRSNYDKADLLSAGAIYIDNGGSVELTSGTIEGNTGTAGAIYVKGGEFTQTGDNGHILSNHGFKGAVVVDGKDANGKKVTSKYTFDAGTIDGNDSAVYGAGITAINEGQVVVGDTSKSSRPEIKNNKTLHQGGGIYVHSNEVTLNKALIDNNVAHLMGGGIYVYGGDGNAQDANSILVLNDAYVTRNKAGNEYFTEEPTGFNDFYSKNYNYGEGGGIWNCSYGSLIMDATKIRMWANEAHGEGREFQKPPRGNGIIVEFDTGKNDNFFNTTGNKNSTTKFAYPKQADGSPNATFQPIQGKLALRNDGSHTIDTNAVVISNNKAGYAGGGIGSNGILSYRPPTNEVVYIPKFSFTKNMKDANGDANTSGKSVRFIVKVYDLATSNTDPVAVYGDSSETNEQIILSDTAGQTTVDQDPETAAENGATNGFTVDGWTATIVLPPINDASGNSIYAGLGEKNKTNTTFPGGTVVKEENSASHTGSYSIDNKIRIEIVEESMEGDVLSCYDLSLGNLTYTTSTTTLLNQQEDIRFTYERITLNTSLNNQRFSQYGKLEITKKDKATNGVLTSDDFKFEIRKVTKEGSTYSPIEGEDWSELTNTNGVHASGKLTEGYYEIKESATMTGYGGLGDARIYVRVNANGNVSLDNTLANVTNSATSSLAGVPGEETYGAGQKLTFDVLNEKKIGLEIKKVNEDGDDLKGGETTFRIVSFSGQFISKDIKFDAESNTFKIDDLRSWFTDSNNFATGNKLSEEGLQKTSFYIEETTTYSNRYNKITHVIPFTLTEKSNGIYWFTPMTKYDVDNHSRGTSVDSDTSRITPLNHVNDKYKLGNPVIEWQSDDTTITRNNQTITTKYKVVNVTTSDDESGSVTFTVENKMKPVVVRVAKVDAENNPVVDSNTSFTIRPANKSGGWLEEKNSANGIYEFDKDSTYLPGQESSVTLTPGEAYALWEDKAPNGYEPLNLNVFIEIDEHGKVRLVSDENELTEGIAAGRYWYSGIQSSYASTLATAISEGKIYMSDTADANGVVTIYVKNEPSSNTPAKLRIEANKEIINGQEGVNYQGQFTFTITGTDANGNPAPMPQNTTATNGLGGKIDFGVIQFDRAGTYTYTISETAGTDPSIIYDTDPKVITVNVIEVNKDSVKKYVIASVTSTSNSVAVTETSETYGGFPTELGSTASASGNTYNYYYMNNGSGGTAYFTDTNLTIDGYKAFCIDQNRTIPAGVTYTENTTPDTDLANVMPKIKKVLYYGYPYVSNNGFYINKIVSDLSKTSVTYNNETASRLLNRATTVAIWEVMRIGALSNGTTYGSRLDSSYKNGNDDLSKVVRWLIAEVDKTENNDVINYVDIKEYKTTSTPSQGGTYQRIIVPGSMSRVMKVEIRDTFKNTINKTSYEVTKIWADNNNAHGSRPVSITVKLYKKVGAELVEVTGVDTKLLAESNNWSASWSNLDKFDGDGNLIQYVARENNVPSGYTASYSETPAVAGGLQPVIGTRPTYPQGCDYVYETGSGWQTVDTSKELDGQRVRIVLNNRALSSSLEWEELSDDNTLWTLIGTKAGGYRLKNGDNYLSMTVYWLDTNTLENDELRWTIEGNKFAAFFSSSPTTRYYMGSDGDMKYFSPQYGADVQWQAYSTGEAKDGYYDIEGNLCEPDGKEEVVPTGEYVDVDEVIGKTKITNTLLDYDIVIWKVDADNQTTKLPGATFTLTDRNGKSFAVTAVAGEDGKYKAEGLVKGMTYTLNETGAPNNYMVLMSPVSFTLNDHGGITLAEGTTTMVSAEVNSLQITVQNKQYPSVKIKKVDVAKPDVVLAKAEFELRSGSENGPKVGGTYTTGSDGYIDLGRLQQGTYYLIETKAPSGYNKLSLPITITVSASGTVTVTGSNVFTESSVAPPEHEAATNAYIFTLGNSSGEELPETGGIGTTILYIAGAILVIGAGVLLIVRKKMNK